MRIVIDLQGAQTESRYRGVGRYTLSLTKSIVRNKGKHDIFITLSDLFPETIELFRAALDSLLPQENIRVWSAPGPVCEYDPGNIWRREAAELVREAFLNNLQPDVVHVMSLFEGYVDDGVTSIGRFDHSTPISVTLYDLIPLIDSDHYLKPNPSYEKYYRRKINQFKQATVFLAISESSRREGIDQLELPPELVINVSAAADEHFQPLLLSGDQTQQVLQKLSISKPFVLCASAFDERKNIPRLIRAFSQLPRKLRDNHQLVLVGKITGDRLDQFKQEIKDARLHANDVIFTGYVDDEELVKLYNLTKLTVLPSWHEGFGLPALEAMACKRAVIGANTSSVPEILGREDMLFDPWSEDAIAKKMTHVLSDSEFRVELEEYGIERSRKFSWDKCAKTAIAAFEKIYDEKRTRASFNSLQAKKPKLAYFSPLPPEHTGIADYSIELLAELSRHYDIDVITDQKSVITSLVNPSISVRDLEWFRSNVNLYDRVLYHFGNSPFHQHMFDLLEKIPGVVVLHDFFLLSVIRHMEIAGFAPGFWASQLYYSHGYKAVLDRFKTKKNDDEVLPYPCNLEVLENALGIIVHSTTSILMAKHWYGGSAADDWAVIPSPRAPVYEFNRQAIRERLNLNIEDFIVCSFGILGPTKLIDRLIDAYLASKLGKRKNCMLILVGENHGGEYGAKLWKKIIENNMQNHIRITGWVGDDIVNDYLAAADIGVQLRTLSRGETSRSVLECMSNGLATIVNAHGSMIDLPNDGVWKLPDGFEDVQLVEALESLWSDAAHRRQLGDRAREFISHNHAPCICAEMYVDSIERFYNKATTNIRALAQEIGRIEVPTSLPVDLTALSRHIAQSIPPRLALRQLLVDVSEIALRDRKDGIHRAVRSILVEILTNPPPGFRVEPVYATPDQGYHYARQFTLNFLGCPGNYLYDEVVEFQNGDIFFGLDWHHLVILKQRDFYQQLRRQGVRVLFLIYDLLPIQFPQYFPEGMAEMHNNWLKVVAESDGAICISKAVADELTTWIKANSSQMPRPFKISSFHLGANIEGSVPTTGLPHKAESILKILQARPAFLMVGTIEPRKGHAQTLTAFEQLWREGVDANLVIVGTEGWKGLSDDLRHTIPGTMNRLRNHPELGKHLFWLEDISDEYLEKVYRSVTCLIVASEGEGFGLPIIEAARHNIPLILRDLPVFREIASNHATYFAGMESYALTITIVDWLEQYRQGKIPSSKNIRFLSWDESAQSLINLLKNLRDT